MERPMSAPSKAAIPEGANLAGLALVVAVLLALSFAACRSGGGRGIPPVPPRASLVFAEGAQSLAQGDAEGARALWLEAARLDPGWAAPARGLDDLDRAALLGPDVLARRREEFLAAPSALAAYLVGRQMGAGATDWFERGVELDPDLGWNHHGIAWNLHQEGNPRAALRPGRRALSAARDTYEQSYFTLALARYELALGRPERAIELLEERLADLDVLPTDRATLEAWLAQAELGSADPLTAERGYRRGIELLWTESLADEELARLAAALLEAPLSWRSADVSVEVAAALGARPGDLRGRLRARILLEGENPALAVALLGDDPARVLAETRLRRALFARGQGREAVEAWLGGLPRFVLDAAGRPRDERLLALVNAARSGSDAELAEALLAAGWFAETRAYAEALAPLEPELALGLEARAAAGIVLFEGIGRVLDLVDRGQPYAGSFAQAKSDAERESGAAGDEHGPRAIRSLDHLLGALEPLFANLHRAQGRADPRVDLLSSPRSRYGPAATVVHPGPVFSAADAAAGLGPAGAPVGGLGSELAALQRFGIFGEALGGGGPDGTVLARVLVEERAGEHLGVPWRGLVAWCEGTDVESRPGRRGARISGAALHEGYWIDLSAVRGELQEWRQLAARFADPARLEAALAVRGVQRSAELGPAGLPPLAGEGDRVRLALLCERAASSGGLSPELVTLEELALLTALHEEGHLCDRTRFLPLGKNLFAALDLLRQGGFTPVGVSRELEERAQLVALCEADDPRMPLADILSAAEFGSAVTPHAAAYRALLEDWLGVLADEAVDPLRFPALDRRREFAHQLHLLTPEEIRGVALRLARKKHLSVR
jgi:hypothetical protein